MTTAIEMLQAFGIFMFGMTLRAAVVLAFIAVLSVPFVAYAYAARTAGSLWHRRHTGAKHAHGVA